MSEKGPKFEYSPTYGASIPVKDDRQTTADRVAPVQDKEGYTKYRTSGDGVAETYYVKNAVEEKPAPPPTSSGGGSRPASPEPRDLGEPPRPVTDPVSRAEIAEITDPGDGLENTVKTEIDERITDTWSHLDGVDSYTDWAEAQRAKLGAKITRRSLIDIKREDEDKKIKRSLVGAA